MDAVDSNSTPSVQRGTQKQERIIGFDVTTTLESTEIEDSLQRSSDLQKKIRKARSTLYSDGKEFVTNVLLATKAEEDALHLQEENETQKIHDYVDQDYVDSEQHFNEISAKWQNAIDIKVPQHLFKLFLCQKSECEKLLSSKDKTIERLKEDFEMKHELLGMARARHEQEELEMQKRIESLIETLHQNGKSEIGQIKESLGAVRHELTLCASKKLQKRLEDKELKNEEFEQHEKEFWDLTRQLAHYRLASNNKLLKERQELCAEVHNFLLQLRDLEITQLLNMDKCNYGLQMLKEQIYENRIVCAEIKRSNVRFFDMLLKLRAQWRMVNRKGQQDYRRELANYQKAYERILSSLKAAKFLHQSHKKIYYSTFQHQEAEARRLLYSVLKTDCFVYEKLLRKPWQLPDLAFLAPKLKPKKSKEAKLLEKLNEFLEGKSNSDSSEDDSDLEVPQENTVKLRKPLDIEKMLRFFCDQLDFLIDKQVLKMAKTVFEDAKTFIVTNSVFNSMGIKTTDDLHILVAYLIHHSNYVSDHEIELNTQSVLSAFEDYIVSQRGKLDVDDLAFDLKSDTNIIKSEFWQKYATTFTKEQEHTWDNVAVALDKYMHELEKHLILSKKKAAILQTNQELEGLLKMQLKQAEEVVCA